MVEVLGEVDTTAPLVVSAHGDFGGSYILDQIGGKAGKEGVMGVVGFVVGVVQNEHLVAVKEEVCVGV